MHKIGNFYESQLSDKCKHEYHGKNIIRVFSLKTNTRITFTYRIAYPFHIRAIASHNRDTEGVLPHTPASATYALPTLVYS